MEEWKDQKHRSRKMNGKCESGMQASGGGVDLGTHFIEPPRVDSWVKTSADPTTYLVTLWYCRPKVTSKPQMQAYVEIKTSLSL